MSLAVVFECGHVARVLVVFDNNSHGEGRAALVSALLARMRLANEIAYMTAEFFIDIGYIAGIECIFGRARWLKTRRTGRLPRALLTFWT